MVPYLAMGCFNVFLSRKLCFQCFRSRNRRFQRFPYLEMCSSKDRMCVLKGKSVALGDRGIFKMFPYSN